MQQTNNPESDDERTQQMYEGLTAPAQKLKATISTLWSAPTLPDMLYIYVHFPHVVKSEDSLMPPPTCHHGCQERITNNV